VSRGRVKIRPDGFSDKRGAQRSGAPDSFCYGAKRIRVSAPLRSEPGLAG